MKNRQSGEELYSAGLSTYIEHEGEYRQQVKRGTAVKYVSVSVTPKFYNDRIYMKCPDLGRFQENGNFGLSVDEYVPEIADVLKQLQTFRPFDAIARAYYDSKVTELLCLMVQWEMKKRMYPEADSIPNPDKEHLEEILAYLDRNYHRHIYIDALARQSCMSRSKLTHLFKQVYGTTIPKHIKTLRINRAKEMLADTNWNIETVGNEVGYKFPGSFTEVFKQFTGCTPKQYRKNTLRG